MHGKRRVDGSLRVNYTLGHKLPGKNCILRAELSDALRFQSHSPSRLVKS